MFLCLIIPNSCHPILQINMVLKPWIDKLKQIREGVEAYHCYKKHKFNLCFAYLWLVHDFVTYDIFSGWGVHGNLRCPICGKETYCFRLQFGGKKSYFDCHRHFLQRNHPFRFERNTFTKDTIITKVSLKRLSGVEIVDMLNKLVLTLEMKGFRTEHN